MSGQDSAAPAGLERLVRMLRRDSAPSLGLMTPTGLPSATLPDPLAWRAHAQQAERLGFAALWARDVPLMIPQGSTNHAAALDDPFAWLMYLAAATEHIALGTAAAVLPLRHPIHLAKNAISLDRLSGGRFILGLGSGDRPTEFAAFGQDHARRATQFRARWPQLADALATDAAARDRFERSTGGYAATPVPDRPVPLVAIGSSRQTLQWIARHAAGWATYYRPIGQQRSRMQLWHEAERQVIGHSHHRLLIQSMQLRLEEDPGAKATELELGLRGGSRALLDYCGHAHRMGIDHLILNLLPGRRPLDEVLEQLGQEVIAQL